MLRRAVFSTLEGWRRVMAFLGPLAGSTRRERLGLLPPLGLLLLGIWLSTGTLAPYAVTLPTAREIGCGYLGNVDHGHFEATFSMLDGAPRERWEKSVVLRRIAFPLLAYPAMKLAGFYNGGLLTSVLLQLLVVLVFCRWLAVRWGCDVGRLSLWLLATYPGIPYWAGLPYSYAAIVPACLVGAMCVDATARATSWGRLLGAAVGIGVCCTAYDLLPALLVPALLLNVSRTPRVARLSVVVAGVLLPQLLAMALLAGVFGVPLRNDNTAAYGHIVGAWLSLPRLSGAALEEWHSTLGQAPGLGVVVYLASNFVFLPAAALLFWPFARGAGRLVVALALPMVAVFAFANLAPAYEGWPLRGDWIARIYQPLLVSLLVATAVGAARLMRRGGLAAVLASSLVAVVVLGNAWVVAAPITANPVAARVYDAFYHHFPGDRPVDGSQAMLVHLRRQGRRPVGFCRTGGT